MNKINKLPNFSKAANLLNTNFYLAVSKDFSRTRQNAWSGWEKLANKIFLHLPSHPKIIDYACGNMRFAKFCTNKLYKFDYLGLDNSNALANNFDKSHLRAEQKTSFKNVDLIKKRKLPLASNSADLVVSFGFFHHIPSYEKRQSTLHYLIDVAKPGGFIAVSLWQFMHEEKIAKKAIKSTEQALAYFKTQPKYKALTRIQHNDYFLNWNKEKNIYRYCHHFDNAEITKLTTSTKKTHLINSFNADGKNNKLNHYLIFLKNK